MLSAFDLTGARKEGSNRRGGDITGHLHEAAESIGGVFLRSPVIVAKYERVLSAAVPLAAAIAEGSPD
jgi:hypothetical protein